MGIWQLFGWIDEILVTMRVVRDVNRSDCRVYNIIFLSGYVGLG
jgi:hypothetical protein